MGSVCSSVPIDSQQILLHSLSSPNSSSISRIGSRSIPESRLQYNSDSSYSNSSGFQVYPHYSAVYGGGQSSSNNVPTSSSPMESVETCLKDVKPVMCRLPGIVDYSRVWKQIITGQFTRELLDDDQVMNCEEKVIYIYHCANYGDSPQERQALQEDVYPTLKDYCSQRGVTLEVVDFTQTVPHYSAHGHACKKISHKVLTDLLTQKPDRTIVTVFFNDNDTMYFYPLHIKKEEFHLMLRKCTVDEKHFLLDCYKLGTTLEEPSYVVQEFNDKEGEKIHIRLRNIISAASTADFQRLHHISDVERNLTSTGVLQNTNFHNKIWIRRNSSEVHWEQVSQENHRMYNTDSGSNSKRANFSDVLSQAFDKARIVYSDVKWRGNGVDPEGDDHESYLKGLTSKYLGVIMPMVNKILESFRELGKRKLRIRNKGLTESLYVDLLHQARHTLQLQEPVFGQNELLEELENYLTKDGHHGDVATSQPLLIRGPPGSGKSAIAAVMANNVFGVSGWKNSCCVMKTANASNQCRTVEQMVYNLAEQLCLLSGLPISLVYQEKSNILHHLLNPNNCQIFTTPPLLIILDGMDHLDTSQQSEDFCNMMWLPKVLPKHVRVVIAATTDSDICNILQKQLPQSNIKDIPRLFMADAMTCFTENRYMGTSQTHLPTASQDKVMFIMKDKPSPLFVQSMSTVLNLQPNVLDDLVKDVGTDINILLQRFFSEVENYFDVEHVRYIFNVMLLSRNGVSLTDLNNLCQNIPSQCDTICNDTVNMKNIVQKDTVISQLQIYTIVNVLQPFLCCTTNQGVTVIKWKYPLFERVLTQRYSSEAITSVQQSFQAYVIQLYEQRQLPTDANEHTISPDYLRALTELPHCYHRSGMHASLTEMITSPEFVKEKIKHYGVQSLLMDFYLLLKHADSCEIKYATDFIAILQTLAPALLFNGTSFELHFTNYKLFCDIKFEDDKSKFRDLYQMTCGKKEVPQLEMKCSVKNFKHGYQRECTSNYVFTGLNRIKGDMDHVIGLATANDELQVINIHTGESHRTLRGIEKPRALRAINMLEMVVLCDREMRIYNVDQGILISRLKGVLNLTLPCFEVQSDCYTMAVSRNRMHINMYNNSTGDVFTTFKVGEDRFLNSLLVSENGEYCVCGDEVRKPFPLLVWDLKRCKLIHDLRIRGHEFITKISALTTDGSLVICASREVENPEPNFLLVYEVQNGSMFTKLKTEYSCTAVAISKQANHVVSAHENGDILVWYLSDTFRSTPKFTLQGHAVGVDKLYLCNDGSRGVTYDSTGRDPFIWMWDFKQGITLGCVESLLGPSSCQISADGHILIACYPGLDKILTFHPKEDSNHEPNITSVYGDASRKAEVFYFNDSTCD